MRGRRTVRTIVRPLLAACLLVGLALPAAADQTDPRLDALFARLQAAPDAAAAQPIEAEIRRIWLEHPDKRTREVTLIGTGFLNGGRPQLAELAFKEAIQRSPDFAEAWNKRATLRYLVGDYTGSIEDCAHVLKLEPRHFGALAGLGHINMALKDWDAAIRWYKEALAVNPNMPGVIEVLEEARKKALGEET